MQTTSLEGGFADAPLQSATAFRAVMTATSRLEGETRFSLEFSSGRAPKCSLSRFLSSSLWHARGGRQVERCAASVCDCGTDEILSINSHESPLCARVAVAKIAKSHVVLLVFPYFLRA